MKSWWPTAARRTARAPSLPATPGGIAQVRLLENEGRLSSAGRNVAVRAARGEIVLLVDGHCRIDDPWHLAEAASAFARSGADCLGRPQSLDVTGATALQRAVAAARSSRLGHHPSSHIYSDREGFVPPQSVAVAYRRSVFETVGLFDEAFDACEDVEFNHRAARAGLRCYFTPRVRCVLPPAGHTRRPVPADEPLRAGPRPAAAQTPAIRFRRRSFCRRRSCAASPWVH